MALAAAPQRDSAPRRLREGELIKHSAAIQISNTLTLLQRKISNVCLMRAYPRLMRDEVHRIPLSELKAALGYRGHNDDKIKDAFRVLNMTQIEWNLFGKDKKHRWGVSTLLAQAELLDGNVCEYAYAPKLRAFYAHPAVYARLNLSVQNSFKSKHAIALWEYLVDALGAKRARATVRIALSELRRLLALGGDEYTEFKALRRRVIDVAIREIGQGADINVTARYVKERRRVVAIDFDVWREQPALIEAEQRDEQDANQDDEECPPTSSTPGERLEACLVREFGVARKQVERLLASFDTDYIEDVLKHVRDAYRVGKVRSLAGYTVRAIQEDYRTARAVPGTPQATNATDQADAQAVEREALQRAFEAHRVRRAAEAYGQLDAGAQAACQTKARAALKRTPWGKQMLKRLDAGEKGGAAQDAFLSAVATFVLTSAEDCDLQAFGRASLTKTEKAQTN